MNRFRCPVSVRRAGVIAACVAAAFAGIARAQEPISIPLLSGTVGVPYSIDFGEGLASIAQSYSQLGITFNYSFTTQDPNQLPPGLSLSITGLISGTPTTPGTYSFPVLYSISLVYQGVPFGFQVPLEISLTILPSTGDQRTTIDATSLSFTFVQGISGTSSQLLTISNPSSETKTFTVALLKPVSFLSIGPSGGTLAPFSSGSVVIAVDPSGLGAGTYVTALSIQVAPSGESFEVPVVITVTGQPQSVTVSQTGLFFAAVQGGQAPASQTVNVLSNGASFAYAATTSTLSGGKWLSVSPASGIVRNGGTSSVQVSVNQAGLNPGTYYGTVVFTSDGFAAPTTTTVVLQVSTPQNSPGPTLSTTGLIFVAEVGDSSPPAQSLTVNNPSPNQEEVSTSISSANSFFGAQTSATTVASGAPITVTAQAFPAGLAPGVYQGEIDLQFTDPLVPTGFMSRIAVVLVVVPSGTLHLGARKMPLAVTCSPTKLVPVFTQLGGGFNVSAGWPVTLELTVIDDCGVYLNSGIVTSSFSNGDQTQSMLSNQNGRWTATWSPHGTSTAQVTITGSANETAPALAGQATIGGAVQGNPSVPTISLGGIVNSANFSQQPFASPGGYISIFGTQLSSGHFASEGTPFATSLGDTQVFLEGKQLPLQIAFIGSTGIPDQINAVVPYNIPLSGSAQLIVQQSGQISSAAIITVATASPAMFVDYGTDVGIIQNVSKGYQLVDSSHPASAGDVLAIYCTGLGAVSNPPAPGAQTLDANSQVMNDVEITIGGVPATNYFAGLAPGFVGLYQVNTVVPASVTAGTDVPVVLTAAGIPSPVATINIQ